MRKTRVNVVLAAVLAGFAALPVSAAQRELTRTDRFPVEAGKVVVVDGADCDVHMRAADVTEIRVTVELHISGVSEAKAERWITNHTPSFADTEERLVVTVTPGDLRFLGLGALTARARLLLVVPATITPDLTTTSGNVHLEGDFAQARPVLLRTATGKMELEGAAHSVDVRSTSGNTFLHVMRPFEHLFARTSSGDVELTGGAQKVEADTASGGLRLHNLSGQVEVVTHDGRVSLHWDRLDAGSTAAVRTVSSRIELLLPAGTTVKGELRTVSGGIYCALPGQVNETGDTVVLQGDGPVLHVETASGEINLEYDNPLQPGTPVPREDVSAQPLGKPLFE